MTEDMNEVDMPGETSKGSRYRKTYHRYKSVIAMGNEKSLVGDHVIVEINSFANPFASILMLLRSNDCPSSRVNISCKVISVLLMF